MVLRVIGWVSIMRCIVSLKLWGRILVIVLHPTMYGSLGKAIGNLQSPPTNCLFTSFFYCCRSPIDIKGNNIVIALEPEREGK